MRYALALCVHGEERKTGSLADICRDMQAINLTGNVHATDAVIQLYRNVGVEDGECRLFLFPSVPPAVISSLDACRIDTGLVCTLSTLEAALLVQLKTAGDLTDLIGALRDAWGATNNRTLTPIPISEILSAARVELHARVALPHCIVCLSRVDPTVTGIDALQCRDIYHSCCQERCRLISSGCRVCDMLFGNPSGPRCSDCASGENLWVCLLCANVGCGRYKGGHAYSHFERTGHSLALKLDSHHIWDYVEDRYVHRTIKSAEGTVDTTVSEESKEPADNSTSNSNFFSAISTAQLESQGVYFNKKLRDLERVHVAELARVSQEHAAHVDSLQEAIRVLKQESRLLTDQHAQTKKRSDTLKAELKEQQHALETEKSITEGLVRKITALQSDLDAAQSEKTELVQQVEDLTQHIGILDLMDKAGNDPDLVQGRVFLRPKPTVRQKR